MRRSSDLSGYQAGIALSAIIGIIAAVIVIGGVIFYTVNQNDADTTEQPVQENSTALSDNVSPQTQVATQPVKQPTQQPSSIEVDADAFCNQIAAVGQVFGKELSGASVRANASYGPKVGCSWHGPSVTVYFADSSYDDMNTGFSAHSNSDYEIPDFPAFSKETSTSTSGIEVRVKSDKGWAIRISDGRGLKEDLTPTQYNQIANIVNDALNEHY